MASATGVRAPARRRRPASGSGVHWDRVGRVALVLGIGVILLLYIGPIHTYISTWREAKAKRAQIHQLEAEHARLLARRRSLQRPDLLEVRARRLGMVRPGERAYSIEHLPGG